MKLLEMVFIACCCVAAFSLVAFFYGCSKHDVKLMFDSLKLIFCSLVPAVFFGWILSHC